MERDSSSESGLDVDEEGVTTEGVKLSMFDISDPGNVTEVSKYILEDKYGTDVAYNYKAVFVDVEKNLFGFRAYGGNGDVYSLFSYDCGRGIQGSVLFGSWRHMAAMRGACTQEKNSI